MFMRHGNRIVRRDIKQIKTLTMEIGLSEGQTFYETDKAFEIWQESNSSFRRIVRYSKKAVYFLLLEDDVWHMV